MRKSDFLFKKVTLAASVENAAEKRTRLEAGKLVQKLEWSKKLNWFSGNLDWKIVDGLRTYSRSKLVGIGSGLTWGNRSKDACALGFQFGHWWMGAFHRVYSFSGVAECLFYRSEAEYMWMLFGRQAVNKKLKSSVKYILGWYVGCWGACLQIIHKN